MYFYLHRTSKRALFSSEEVFNSILPGLVGDVNLAMLPPSLSFCWVFGASENDHVLPAVANNPRNSHVTIVANDRDYLLYLPGILIFSYIRTGAAQQVRLLVYFFYFFSEKTEIKMFHVFTLTGQCHAEHQPESRRV